MNKIKTTILLIFFGLSTIALAQELPSPIQPPRLVNDFAQILTEREQSMLEAKLRAYHDTTSTQIYIITVPDLQGYDVADYAIRIGEKWGVGQQSKNNGAVILVKPRIGNERGEGFIATGYGLEDVIPDAIAKRIMEREMIPAFQQDDYYAGFDRATTVMISLASGKFTADGYMGEGGFFAVLPFIIFLTLLFVVLFNVNKTKGRSIGKNIPFWIALGMMSGGGRSGGFGGFSSGGGSFGGFSGGGGGSFGGGGARGSW
ncbi:MAG TPA: TPM domain-containing protein [Tenuifilaceae bacterium]|nr:TPM domain-containing protein [Tenuifilaceae bacterium]